MPFLVIGAMKSGTTSLEKVLKRHPDITLVADKEATLCRTGQGAREFRQRVRSAPGRVAGEVSTAYLQAPLEVIDHAAIASVLPQDTRLIAILRDPYTRAISHWQHWEQLGRNLVPLDEALRRPDLPYVGFSRYAEQLDPWIAAFGVQQLTLIRLEDFTRDPNVALAPMWESLDVRPEILVDPVHENERTSRVVARSGAARTIRGSRAYQRARHLVPTAAKRGVLKAIGGTRSMTAKNPDHTARAAFELLVADDLRKLRSVQPRLTWEVTSD